MKKLFLLGFALSPLMLSAELVDETVAALDCAEDLSLIDDEQEVSYLSDNLGNYYKRSARSSQDDDSFEEEDQPKYNLKSARSAVASQEAEQECKPKPKPECKPKPACPPKCKPEPMYRMVTKQVKCCPPAKQVPEPCCCLMYPSAHETMIQEGANLDVFADWLYYQATEVGLVYTTMLYADDLIGSVVHSFPDPVVPGYHSGFRVGFDYTMEHNDDWQLLFSWTRFNQNSSFSNAVPDFGFYANVKTSFYTAGEGEPGARTCNATWHLNYNVLDATLGRDFYSGKKLFLKPYLGFRAAWINQKFNANYDDLLDGGQPETSCYANGKQTFDGYGMDFGADGRFMFSKHFGLYSKVSGSLLWGIYENKILNGINTQTNPTKIEKYTIKTIQPVVDMAVGFEWENYFSCDTYYLSIHAGWEQSLWVGHNHMFASGQMGQIVDGGIVTFDNSAGSFINAGQLSLAGISAGLTFGF